jgi:hypothetical protein
LIVPKPSMPTHQPVKTERVRITCPAVDGIDPMKPCGRVQETPSPTCSEEYDVCDAIKAEAARCWAAHKALVKCVERHNEQ